MPMIDPERAAHMEQLANDLDAIVARLNLSLDRQEQLTAQVEAVRRRNRFLVASVAITLLIAAGAIALGFTALLIDRQREEDRQHTAERFCERTVETRDDNRAMWLWLIDAVSTTSPLAGEARVELDRLLPVLVCDDDNNPVPD